VRNETAIVGVGLTPVGKVPGVGVFELHLLAIERALVDAGLELGDIDGLIVAESRSGTIVEGTSRPPYYSDRVPPFHIHGPRLGEYLGLKLRYALTLGLGGATTGQMIHIAAAAVAAGMADRILVVSADDMYSNVGMDLAVKHVSESVSHPGYELPYNPSMPAYQALVARAYMERYGLSRETLSKVAVTMRANALRTPEAHMHAAGPLTTEDVEASRLIATPLHLFDCAPVSDGGAALIVASKAAAESATAPVLIRGAGQGHAHMYITQVEDITTNDGARLSGERAFTMAGVSPSDVDLLLLYDAFTIQVAILLEDLGFARAGGAGELIDGGEIELGGTMPVNTHGGLHSFGHPRRPGALFGHVEAVRQLRSDVPEERQVNDAELALVHSFGGPFDASNCTVIYERAA
jgi:acetyl-CoA acetyltransferase